MLSSINHVEHSDNTLIAITSVFSTVAFTAQMDDKDIVSLNRMQTVIFLYSDWICFSVKIGEELTSIIGFAWLMDSVSS